MTTSRGWNSTVPMIRGLLCSLTKASPTSHCAMIRFSFNFKEWRFYPQLAESHLLSTFIKTLILGDLINNQTTGKCVNKSLTCFELKLELESVLLNRFSFSAFRFDTKVAFESDFFRFSVPLSWFSLKLELESVFLKRIKHS